MTEAVMEDLQRIPGVGKAIAYDMAAIGINSCDDLRGKDPEQLYERLCDYKGGPVDRCMLYVFRCAVYWACNDEHDPELLKWWNWKDES